MNFLLHTTSTTHGEPAGGLLLTMSGIGKEFSGVQVLSDVQFDLRRGEVHVLAGENGAGKSTLIKILAGVYTDFDGVVTLAGEPVRFKSTHEAASRGISVMYQEMSLVGSMNVVENIFLGREETRGSLWLDKKTEVVRATQLLREVGADLVLDRLVEEYPVSVQQLIEIAKALAVQANIIVMDEPTSSLSDVETARLFSLIGVLKARGCGIVYITHKMEEIYRIADRITVLRDGRYVGTGVPSDLSHGELIRWMIGWEIDQQFPGRAPALQAMRLQVEHVALRDPADPSRYIVNDISFEVRAGEILGLAGLQGSGNSELLNGLFGAYGGVVDGTVRIDGEVHDVRSPRRSIENGVALLTNDRKTTGLVMDMGVAHNITLAALDRFSPGGWLRPDKEAEAACRQSDALHIRASGLAQEVATLSGGTQQKVALAKWLETRPKVLLLDDPTRGVDVAVKHEIYDLMNRWTREGCALVLVTSEMPELLAMSDRIAVMYDGRCVAEFDRGEATQEAVLHAAMGGGRFSVQ